MAFTTEPVVRRGSIVLSSVTLDYRTVSGWLIDLKRPGQPRHVDVHIGDRLIGRILAGDLVPVGDLAAVAAERAPDLRLDRRQYPVGFTFRIPDFFQTGPMHDLRVSCLPENEELFGLQAPFGAETSRFMRETFDPLSFLLSINLEEMDGDQIEVTVDILLRRPAPSSLWMLLNGKTFDTVAVSESTFAMHALFDFDKTRAKTRLVGRAKAPPSGQPLEIGIIDKVTGEEMMPVGDHLCFPADWKAIARSQPLPSGEALNRTIHVEEDDRKLLDDGSAFDQDGKINLIAAAYLFGGFRDLHIFDHVAREVADRSIIEEKGIRILDWGCGTGRLTHHLGRLPNAEAWGGDIDHKNLSWGRENIQTCKFVQLPLMPPTDLPSAYFDFIIGISVFTHLDRDRQVVWLMELSRILKPDGIALVTVAGLNSFLVSRLRSVAEGVPQLLATGYMEFGGKRLESTGIGEGYYKNTKQTSAFTHGLWGPYVEILDFLPGRFRSLQDIVVFKRKAHASGIEDGTTDGSGL